MSGHQYQERIQGNMSSCRYRGRLLQIWLQFPLLSSHSLISENMKEFNVMHLNNFITPYFVLSFHINVKRTHHHMFCYWSLRVQILLRKNTRMNHLCYGRFAHKHEQNHCIHVYLLYVKTTPQFFIMILKGYSTYQSRSDCHFPKHIHLHRSSERSQVCWYKYHCIQRTEHRTHQCLSLQLSSCQTEIIIK